MDYLDDFYVDEVYEEFSCITGHVTDFDVKEYHLYRTAVEQYKNICPESNLCVGVGYHSFQGGLYHLSGGDLSSFWKLFDDLSKEIK